MVLFIAGKQHQGLHDDEELSGGLRIEFFHIPVPLLKCEVKALYIYLNGVFACL
jgi:hypothetical protein